MAPLKHRKCGGYLAINIAGLFSFKSPSLGMSMDGLSVGVLEIQENPNGRFTFSCSKCGSELETTDTSNITVECSVCHKFRSADTISISQQLGGVCENCMDMLTGKQAPSEEVEKILEYIYLPKDSGIKFVPYAEILTKKIKM